ncbi:MAG: hypothetical protein P8J86_05160 [Phycisphaerales bacterium]|nr:hypothetical protein [Phycisphaerales bacterium]
MKIKLMNSVILFTITTMSVVAWSAPNVVPETDQPQEDQELKAPTEDTPPKEETPATLDELLGIQNDNKEAPEDAARLDQDEDLDRELEEASMQDNFSVAIEKMEISANMLGSRHQSGLGTQRIQEDILKRLEYLMDQAKEQQSMQSQSSQQSSSQSKPSQEDLSQPQEGQQQQQAQNQQAPGQGESNGQTPPKQEGDINSNLEEQQREWGMLPDRIREQLLQGRNEAFSRLYEKMTRSYYRLLAEEESP